MLSPDAVDAGGKVNPTMTLSSVEQMPPDRSLAGSTLVNPTMTLSSVEQKLSRGWVAMLARAPDHDAFER